MKERLIGLIQEKPLRMRHPPSSSIRKEKGSWADVSEIIDG
jgi:hypothetical protein